MFKQRLSLSIALGLSLALLCQHAAAATVVLTGDTVVYQYDDVTNADALALFGTPDINGDNVRFLPPSFRAQSNDGGPDNNGEVVTTSANFIFDRIYSKSGAALAQINVFEFGDYEIINDGEASLDLELTASTNQPNFVGCATCSVALDYSGDSNGNQSWLVEASLSPVLLFSSDANDIAVSIMNTLVAATDAEGEVAWIQKKFVLAATTEVPLPGAAWLFMSAMGMLRILRAGR